MAYARPSSRAVRSKSRPYVPPLNAFGTYWDAPHRVFMSATVTDDAFLVKGLQLDPATIMNPSTYTKERWSGEKMVLIPSLIHDELDRGQIVAGFGPPNTKRRFGVVTLAPGFNWTRDQEKCGATVAKKETVAGAIDVLRSGTYDRALLLVNRYDGIDLPDDTCRILTFDSKPFSESLIDLYQEMCRPDSEATLMRTIRTIEQGMGRSVPPGEGLFRRHHHRRGHRAADPRQQFATVSLAADGDANRDRARDRRDGASRSGGGPNADHHTERSYPPVSWSR